MGWINTLKKFFTTGIFALLPIAVALWLVISLIRWINNIFVKPFVNTSVVNFYFSQLPEWLQPWIIGIIGLAVVVTAITGLGILTNYVFGKWLISLIDLFMKKVPLANTVYSFVQGLIENLRVMQVGFFKQVVLVEYPRPGIYALGFITKELTGTLQQALEGERVAVFIPTSPNPTSGYITLLQKSDIQLLDMSPEDGLKFIMSGGVLMPGVPEESSGTVK